MVEKSQGRVGARVSQGSIVRVVMGVRVSWSRVAWVVAWSLYIASNITGDAEDGSWNRIQWNVVH